MTPEQIEALAHRMAWRYRKSADPAHSDTFTFNRETLLQFAGAVCAPDVASRQAAQIQVEALQERINRAGVEKDLEVARLRAAVESAAYQLTKARIWGGMEWHYNPLAPMHYKPALEQLRSVLDGAATGDR